MTIMTAEQYEASLQGKITFISPECKGAKLVLAIESCSTVCADLSTFQGMEIQVITTVGDGERFIQETRAQKE